MELVVTKEFSGSNLLQFLAEKLPMTYSKRRIKSFLEFGSCSINGRIERFASQKLNVGDKVVFITPKFSQERVPKFSKKHLLHEDDSILVIDKPPGLACSPVELLSWIGKRSLLIVHRLDRFTSGVLLLAKSQAIAEIIEELFRTRRVDKIYLAIAYGEFKSSEGVIDYPMIKEGYFEGQTLWACTKNGGGKSALTKWRLKSSREKASLIELYPETGRTHQIRVHLREIGHPIVGDMQYKIGSSNLGLGQRQMLHARKLSFPHPTNKKNIEFSAPIPRDFKELMHHFGLE